MKEQVTLSEEYGPSINTYTFTSGDEDAKSFTIRNQGTIIMYFIFTLSIEDGCKWFSRIFYLFPMHGCLLRKQTSLNIYTLFGLRTTWKHKALDVIASTLLQLSGASDQKFSRLALASASFAVYVDKLREALFPLLELISEITSN